MIASVNLSVRFQQGIPFEFFLLQHLCHFSFNLFAEGVNDHDNRLAQQSPIKSIIAHMKSSGWEGFVFDTLFPPWKAFLSVTAGRGLHSHRGVESSSLVYLPCPASPGDSPWVFHQNSSAPSYPHWAPCSCSLASIFSCHSQSYQPKE